MRCLTEIYWFVDDSSWNMFMYLFIFAVSSCFGIHGRILDGYHH